MPDAAGPEGRLRKILACRKQMSGPSNIDHLYTEAMLREAFAQLTILELKAYESEITEGSGHCGKSALISLVARR